MAVKPQLIITSVDPEHDQLLKDLFFELQSAGLHPEGVEKPLKDGQGKALGPVFFLALMATPAAIKFASKVGDAIIEWVKHSRPQTVIALEYQGRKIKLRTNQLKVKTAEYVTLQIRSLLSDDEGQVRKPLMGGGHGGGEGGGKGGGR